MTLGYIDPGSGMILLQVLLSVLVGAGIYFRRAVVWFFTLPFRALSNKNQESERATKHLSEEDSSKSS